MAGFRLLYASRRDLLREQLLQWARADGRVAAAALTGSAAAGTEDRWSDVDLFFGVAGAEPAEVLQDLSDYAYGQLSAVHHFDLAAGKAIYRAFLLDGLLEVDLGLAPIEEFRSHGGAPFRVVYGQPKLRHPARQRGWTSTISPDWSGITCCTRAARSNGAALGRRNIGSAPSVTSS